MNILAYFEIFEGNLTRLYSPYIYKSKAFQVGIDNLSPYGHFYEKWANSDQFSARIFLLILKYYFGH